jgi:hypothetical protein
MNKPNPSALPLACQLAGFWLIWSAWCSASGWLLSAAHQLDGWGYMAMLPVLVGCGWYWLKSAAPRAFSPGNPFHGFFRRLRQPAPLVYFCIVLLSLLAGLLYAPWGADVTIYRLPRILYWWSAHHWHWIGTLDRRLDYSSVGFEWQMLPVIIGTRSDRFLFLLNWIPFLLMPGLVFVAFRALGVNGRGARRWMWLLPSGFCFALECSGLQNDGYTAGYVLAAVAFAVAGLNSRRPGWVLMALLAAALLTGAKLSNLPLLLPLGVLIWPALAVVRWTRWRVPIMLAIAALSSFAPLAFECWRYTGDWEGDPADQWHIKSHGAPGTFAANVILLVNDAVQPPYLPGNHQLNSALQGLNHSSFMQTLEESHRQFHGIVFGNLAYEGGAGPGIGLAAYTAILILGAMTLRQTTSRTTAPAATLLPWAVRLAPWLAWVSYAVFLAKLGSYQSARIAAPYYPLLLVALLRCPRVAAFERKKLAGVLAVVAAALVLPVIFLTPVRPLVPVQTAARFIHLSALEKTAADYRIWAGSRDGLGPIRAQLRTLPPDAARLGYAGGFLETPYGLFQPFGRRAIVELGLPLGSNRLPPPDVPYAVVTDGGLQARYQMDLKTWLDRVGGEVLFTFSRNTALDAHSASQYVSWYLVKLNTSATNHLDAPHETAH